MSQVQIKDIEGHALPLMHYTVSKSKNPDDPYIDDFFTDFAGNSSWPHYGIPYKDTFLHVNYYNKIDDFEYQMVSGNTEHDIFITLKRATLPQIKTNGLYFNVEHLRGNTDFLLYKKYLDGIDIVPIISQRHHVGSKFVRTFGMVDSFSKWHPQDYGNRYYDEIVDVAKLLNDYGLYWYFNVFADSKIVMPSLSQQLDHYNRVVDELSKCPNVFLELVNEQGQHDNSVEREKFNKPLSICSCSGSFGGRVPPQEPHWDFIDYHTRRDYPGSVMECNTTDYNDNGKTRESIGKPIGTGEPMKFGIGNETDERKAFELGHAGFGSSPFNVFHSQQGVNSELFDSVTENLAMKFFS